MRIAILSDIHGNSLALEAVLDDIQARGSVDGYWILGDLCTVGYDPVGVLEKLDQLSNKVVIKGNGDRYVSNLDSPSISLDTAINDKREIRILMEIANNFGWTSGALDSSGWMDWLKKLPFDHRLTLPDRSDVLLIHAQPHTDEGEGLNPGLLDDELENLLANVNEKLICVGHFHMPMQRYIGDQQIINPGAISNSFYGDTRAHYAILTATDETYNIKFFAVSYDIEAVINYIKANHSMGNDYNIRILTGQISASWQEKWDGVSYFPTIEPELTSNHTWKGK